MWKNLKNNYLKHLGFVYKITNLINGKYYIGMKLFWYKHTKPPLKGKKNKRHSQKESDWKTYWGSSNKLKSDIEKYGEENFERKILHYCDTKFDCAYNELIEQVKNNVLFDENSYNEIINVRLNRKKD